MEYDVVTDDSILDFIEKVNGKIADGWKPIGGVSTSGQYSSGYCQAMIWEGQDI
jgi:hypothetical protein